MKCKLDLTAWDEVSSGEWRLCRSGRLHVRLSAPAALYATDDGVETLVGFDSEFEVIASGPFDFFVDGLVRVFVFRSDPSGVPVSGVPFANVERLPMESGSLYEVKRALRLQQFERRELMKEMRREADQMRQLRATLRAESAAPEPKAEAKPEPKADIEPKPEAKPEAEA